MAWEPGEWAELHQALLEGWGWSMREKDGHCLQAGAGTKGAGEELCVNRHHPEKHPRECLYVPQRPPGQTRPGPASRGSFNCPQSLISIKDNMSEIIRLL